MGKKNPSFKIVDKKAYAKALALGAAFKMGFPATYTKTQTHPINRVTRPAQLKEVQRLFWTVKALGNSITPDQCLNQIRKKYKKYNAEFLLKKGDLVGFP